MPEHKTHPAADLFPMMTEEEIDKLAKSIKTQGLRFPIVRWKKTGEIVDGRNRLKACQIAGVAPHFEDRDFADGDAVVAYVLALNIERRHLKPGQIAQIVLDADELVKRLKGEAAAKMSKGKANLDPLPNLAEGRQNETVREQLAKAAGVAGGTMGSAMKVKDKGAPELREAVKAGKVAVSVAADLADSPKEEQVKALAKGKKAVRAKAQENRVKRREDRKKGKEAKTDMAAKPLRRPKPVPQLEAFIYPDDPIAYLNRLETQSVDLLLSAPPGLAKVSDLSRHLAGWVPLALSRVKDTGRAYLFVGTHPLELGAYLDVLREERRLSLGDVLALVFPPAVGLRVAEDYAPNWKVILSLRGCRAPLLSRAAQFVPQAAMTTTLEARAESLIRGATEEGQVVLDPFAEEPVFVLTAARQKRQGFGCTLDSKMDAALVSGCQRGA